MKTIFDGKTGVVLVGNPGVGKSSIHNALGGKFRAGFSCASGLTRDITIQDVSIDKRSFMLVDMPGICDTSSEKEKTEESLTDLHLSMLRDTLNDGHAYVVIFVITPRNGRIDPSQLALMQLVLSNMENGPLVGLILTQVKKRDYANVTSPGYFSEVIRVLENNDANLRFLDKRGPLILLDHEEQFSDLDRHLIQKYVCSCTPRQVQIRNLAASALSLLVKLLKITGL
ncbi:hypothetical protein BGZ83_011929 [Gryganskiella cystojenkinii]|nr:hypothetical protein BGZ83_011929 [Gryganskiella cystojenkinii]